VREREPEFASTSSAHVLGDDNRFAETSYAGSRWTAGDKLLKRRCVLADSLLTPTAFISFSRIIRRAAHT